MWRAVGLFSRASSRRPGPGIATDEVLWRVNAWPIRDEI